MTAQLRYVFPILCIVGLSERVYMRYMSLTNPSTLNRISGWLQKATLFVLFVCFVPITPTFAAGVLSDEELAAGAVGKVGLVLGRAYIQSPGDSRKPAKMGSLIQAQDRILTESNGHVHVRFLDEALVSVRPDSRLEIVSYEYNAQRPEASTVKFNLEEGVTRSISGNAAQSAKERFRLNTPIAAIGVRGTDFVVSATDNSVRALVNEGAIVLAPYSAQCSIDALGPCIDNAVELTHTAFQLVEFDDSSTAPRLLPAPHERDSSGLSQEVQLAMANTESSTTDKTVSNEVFLESTSNNEVTLVASNTAGLRGTGGLELSPDFTPPTPVEIQTLTNSQLVWGRWSEGQGDLERITLPFSEAREGREVGVGVLGSDYILFRPMLGSRNVDDNLGVVSFGLSSAQAFYHSNSGVVAMRVDGGNLSINFPQQLFSTSLDLDHDLTGLVNFSAGGSLTDDGFFNSRTSTERLAGAVTLDGSEAGYFFEQQLQNGDIQGLTLWNNQ